MGVFTSIAMFTAVLCCIVTAISPAAYPAEPTLPAAAAACLECHGQRGLRFTFENGESVEAYVDPAAFRRTVHAPLGCSACHPEFTAETHPKRAFRSKELYTARSAQVCRRCHSEDQLKGVPIHASLSGRDAPACTACHSAHAVGRTTAGPLLTEEKNYCLGCHGSALTLSFRDGTKKSVRVDAAVLDQSVHARLSCFDCHFGFTMTEHPKRSFRSSRDFSLAHADACRRCHFDKYTKTLESIHYAVLSAGNTAAPVCTDCHGSHSVKPTRADRTAGARRCGACHGRVYDVYARSVHGKALVEEHNRDVPACTDCHTAHSILPPASTDYRDHVPEMCGKCHANEAVMKKYGLYTGVVKSYLQDFHGVTLKLYRRQAAEGKQAPRKDIATCVDCHGIHDISTTTGPYSTLVKERLVKQCEQCHPGATKNFPDAWLSHYEPSLTNAPLVFAVNLMYSILIPFMMVGLVIQILLHIWRYAVNR